MVLVTKPMFFDMGNHLRPLSEAPDRPEGQELGRGAVGGTQRYTVTPDFDTGHGQYVYTCTRYHPCLVS